MSRRVALVVNPTSGRGRALRLLPEVAGTLRDADCSVQLLLSRDPAEADDLAAGAVAAEVDVLAVMGGDGMMHLGVNAVASARDGGSSDPESGTVLGLVPAGTGNDLCRGLGLDPRDPVAAARVVADGETRLLDAARVGDRYLGGVLATGFDALVNARANAMSWPKGSQRYTAAVLAELRVFTPLAYTLTVDGWPRTSQAMLVAVGNTSCYGGGLRICPDADAEDGLLDVTVIHPVSRLKLLQLFPQMYSGRFVADPCVEQFRAREVTLAGPGLVGYGDGERIGPAPLTISSRPRALPVRVPAAG